MFGWGMVLDMRDILHNAEEIPHIGLITPYFDLKDLVQRLVISPEIYESCDVYEHLYEEYGVLFDSRDFRQAIDIVDQLYRLLYQSVEPKIKPKFKNEPYRFHKWIGDSNSAIIGSAPISRQNQI